MAGGRGMLKCRPPSPCWLRRRSRGHLSPWQGGQEALCAVGVVGGARQSLPTFLKGGGLVRRVSLKRGAVPLPCWALSKDALSPLACFLPSPATLVPEAEPGRRSWFRDGPAVTHQRTRLPSVEEPGLSVLHPPLSGLRECP